MSPLAAALLFAVTLVPGTEQNDVFALDCFAPPALEVHAADPNVAYAACSEGDQPGVVPIRIRPGLPLDFTGSDYLLPANLECSESFFPTPRIGNLSLEPALLRGWLSTSNCELAIPIDLATAPGDVWLLWQGGLRRAVPTSHQLTGPFDSYTHGGVGGTYASFFTNFTADVVRVGGRLLVATSNIRIPGNSPELYPGTVLLFDIDDANGTPTVAPANPPYLVTSDPNPTALTLLPDGLVAVTNTGLLDITFPSPMTGVGSIDVIDPVAGTLVGSLPVGSGTPGGRTLAVDPTGSVAVAASPTRRELYAFDIRGLDALPRAAIDPTLQRASCNDGNGASADGVACLRERVIRGAANPIALGGTPDGFLPEVRFGASGDFVAVTSFNDGDVGLFAFDPLNLERPHPLLATRFGAPETVSATPPAGQFGTECCPGPMLLHANSAGGVDGAHLIWATASPVGTVMRATLQGSLPAASGDYDLDSVVDSEDNCPLAANPAQTDSGGQAGVGDPCECGDVDDDGDLAQSDVDALGAFLAEIAPLAAAQKCDVAGPPGEGACNVVDRVVLARALVDLGPGIELLCPPAAL